MTAEEFVELERTAIDAVSLPIEHVPDAETRHWDAELRGELLSSTHSRAFAWVDASESTLLTASTRTRSRGPWTSSVRSRSTRS